MLATDARVVPRNFCIAGNPHFIPLLKARSRELATRRIFAKFISPGIISDTNGRDTFYLDTKNANVNYWGSSIFATSNAVDGGHTKVTVPYFTLRGFFDEIDVNPADLVVLHMNAEGGEFLAIPQAFKTAPFVNMLTI